MAPKKDTKLWSKMSEEEWAKERKRVQHIVEIHYQK